MPGNIEPTPAEAEEETDNEEDEVSGVDKDEVPQGAVAPFSKEAPMT